MSEQAAKLGLDITFIEAVDGRTIDPIHVPEYLHDKRTEYGRPPLLPNAIACALSHKRALQTFLTSEARAAVVLEDDAMLESDFETVVNAVVSEARSWDLVKLWRTKMRRTAHFPIRRLAGGFKLVAPLSTTHGTVAILYSRVGAQKALLSLGKFFEDIDTHLGRCWITGLRILEVRPHVVRHAESESTIDAEGLRSSPRSQQPRSIKQRVRRRAFKLAHSVLNPLYAAHAALVVSACSLYPGVPDGTTECADASLRSRSMPCTPLDQSRRL